MLLDHRQCLQTQVQLTCLVLCGSSAMSASLSISMNNSLHDHLNMVAIFSGRCKRPLMLNWNSPTKRGVLPDTRPGNSPFGAIFVRPQQLSGCHHQYLKGAGFYFQFHFFLCSIYKAVFETSDPSVFQLSPPVSGHLSWSPHQLHPSPLILFNWVHHAYSIFQEACHCC